MNDKQIKKALDDVISYARKEREKAGNWSPKYACEILEEALIEVTKKLKGVIDMLEDKEKQYQRMIDYLNEFHQWCDYCGNKMDHSKMPIRNRQDDLYCSTKCVNEAEEFDKNREPVHLGGDD